MSSPYLLRVPAEEDELDDIAVGAGQLAAIRAGECQDVLVERGEGVGVDGEDADVREAERGGHLVQCFVRDYVNVGHSRVTNNCCCGGQCLFDPEFKVRMNARAFCVIVISGQSSS